MAYQIRVNCDCGKILKIPEKYAGKRGRCPNCGKKIAIPSMEDLQDNIQKPPTEEGPSTNEDRNCPTCGAYIRPGDSICVSCHTNLSTGEWDSEGLAIPENSSRKYHFLGSVLVLGSLVLVAGILLVYNFFIKSSPTTSVVESKPVLHEANEDKAAFQAILAMPEKTADEIFSKMTQIQTFLESKMGKLPLWEMHNLYLALCQEKEAEEAFQRLKTQNIVERYLVLDKLIRKYNITKYAKETLVPELKKLEEEVVLLSQRQVEELEKLSQDPESKELTIKAVAWLQKMLSVSLPLEGVTKEAEKLAQIVKTYEERLLTTPTKEEPIAQTNPAVKDEWSVIKKEFQAFLPKYRNYQKSWNFHKALTEMQTIVQKAQPYQEKAGEEADFIKMENLLEEAKLLAQAWDYIIEGTQALKGKEETLVFIKGSAPMMAKVVKYQEGKVFIEGSNRGQENEKQQTAVAIKDLTPHFLGVLATKNNAKNPDVYVALAAFYYIINEEAECRESVQNALKYGSTHKRLDEYQKWASGLLTERKEREAEKARLKEEEIARQKGLAEEARMEKLRRKAWDIVKKVLQEYRLHNEKEVLEALYTLKIEVGDKASGRDELVKIHYIVKKEEGQGLKEMASNSFEYCPPCRNSAVIKCPECKGKGFIEGKTITLSGEKDIKYKQPDKPCHRCNGKTEIDCPDCREKRHDRKYQMIKDYYNNF